MKVAVFALSIGLQATVALGQTEHGALVAVAVPTANGTTLVATKAADGSGVVARRELDGLFRVPHAAPGDRLGGMSSDQGSVLLERLDEPASASEFRLLRTRGKGIGRRIALKGRWSFDAISPNGRLVFLIQHDIGGDPTHYAVRLYDVAKGKLQPGKIADKREIDEEMSGAPAWRETGADGNWAFTLYERVGAAPFIHALEVTTGVAVCVDLPITLAKRAGMRLKMRGPSRLGLVDQSGIQIALIAVGPRLYDDFRVLDSAA